MRHVSIEVHCLPRLRGGSSTCIGAGFVALDWVCLDREVQPAQTFAGGSCGNVLSILAYLGWKAIPLVRLKNDSPAESLLRDLEEWKVITRFITKDARGSTPVVIQRILKDQNGVPCHKFEWRFPATGERVPSYRPLPKRLAAEFLPQLPTADFFYMDRAEPSTLLLAKALREKGAIVFFEPSGICDPRLFSECLGVSDIVKYSRDRLEKIPDSASPNHPTLEVRTLGSSGLEYRLRTEGQRQSSWQFMPAFPVSALKDTCGAGDWCSAGIIDYLRRQPWKTLREINQSQGEAAIRHGQALAAVSCQFEGARGAMYEFRNRDRIEQQVEALGIS